MKIRTDFVTNSSSSNFIVQLSFVLKSGKSINYKFESMGEEAECPELVWNVSPKQLGTAKTVNEMIQSLTSLFASCGLSEDNHLEGVCPEDLDEDLYAWYEYWDDFKTLIFELKGIHDMSEITHIKLEGTTEYQDEETFHEVYSYDLDSGEYTAQFEGEEEESEGGGGHFSFDSEYLS